MVMDERKVHLALCLPNLSVAKAPHPLIILQDLSMLSPPREYECRVEGELHQNPNGSYRAIGVQNQNAFGSETCYHCFLDFSPRSRNQRKDECSLLVVLKHLMAVLTINNNTSRPMKPFLQKQMQRVESKIEIDVQEDPDEIKYISCRHTIKLESPPLESSKCCSSPLAIVSRQAHDAEDFHEVHACAIALSGTNKLSHLRAASDSP
ncbi:hypothetical protein ACRRTK_003361 [Alexandromys fortis]